jgi:hypothetical protein
VWDGLVEELRLFHQQQLSDIIYRNHPDDELPGHGTRQG